MGAIYNAPLPALRARALRRATGGGLSTRRTETRRAVAAARLRGRADVRGIPPGAGAAAARHRGPVGPGGRGAGSSPALPREFLPLDVAGPSVAGGVPAARCARGVRAGA